MIRTTPTHKISVANSCNGNIDIPNCIYNMFISKSIYQYEYNILILILILLECAVYTLPRLESCLELLISTSSPMHVPRASILRVCIRVRQPLAAPPPCPPPHFCFTWSTRCRCGLPRGTHGYPLGGVRRRRTQSRSRRGSPRPLRGARRVRASGASLWDLVPCPNMRR